MVPNPEPIDADDVYNFIGILDHWKKQRHTELQVEWYGGEKTQEPLSILQQDDPVSVAEYAQKQDLLSMQPFQWCKEFLDNQVIANSTARSMIVCAGKSKCILAELQGESQCYQFGYKLPKNMEHAYELDEQNRNTKWGDAM